MAKPSVNYAVYLVTDSTPAILGDKDLAEIVEQAIRGGVTCVQYRDKDGEQSAVVAMAKRLHTITKKYGVPLLINDRVDVAAEIDCEGVHIGQDDMGKSYLSNQVSGVANFLCRHRRGTQDCGCGQDHRYLGRQH